MATQQDNKPQTSERKAASPAEISKATVEVSALLAGLSPAEQWRVIHAAAAINGIQPPKSNAPQQRTGNR